MARDQPSPAHPIPSVAARAALAGCSASLEAVASGQRQRPAKRSADQPAAWRPQSQRCAKHALHSCSHACARVRVGGGGLRLLSFRLVSFRWASALISLGRSSGAGCAAAAAARGRRDSPSHRDQRIRGRAVVRSARMIVAAQDPTLPPRTGGPLHTRLTSALCLSVCLWLRPSVRLSAACTHRHCRRTALHCTALT